MEQRKTPDELIMEAMDIVLEAQTPSALFREKWRLLQLLQCALDAETVKQRGRRPYIPSHHIQHA